MNAEDWRSIQFFLDDKPMAVAEVQARHVPSEDGTEKVLIFRCTCKAYSDQPLIACSHIQVVFKRVKVLGTYITPLRRPLSPMVAFAALNDPVAYRRLMLYESEIYTLEEVVDDEEFDEGVVDEEG